MTSMCSIPKSGHPRAVIADDHAFVRRAVTGLLASTHEVVATVGDGEALLEAARNHEPDLLIVDINMPRLSGLEALPQLRSLLPNALIIIITVTEDQTLARQASALGANAFVLKSRLAKDLTRAMSAAAEGDIYVSPMSKHAGS
ncbi:MAG: response regulator transcription factor [bacterium]|nr:response regulator transcription factor [bacterium]